MKDKHNMQHHALTFCVLDASDRIQIKDFYRQEKEKVRVIEKDLYCVLLDQTRIVAALRLEKINTENAYILRNVQVAKTRQRQGLALKLIDMSLQEVADQQCFCFAYARLLNLYLRSGFVAINIEQQPHLHRRFQRYQKKEVVFMQHNKENLMV